MLITATTGNENFQTVSAKCYIFHVPTPQFPGMPGATPGDRVEAALGVIAKAGIYGITVFGRPAFSPAAPGYSRDFGQWNRSTYDVSDGMVLKVYAQRKTAEMTAGRHSQAAMFLRLRAAAPFHRVSARLTGDQRASISTAPIEGRFDILTVPEARGLGVRPTNWDGHHSRSNREVMFTVEVLEPGLTASPEVTMQEVQNSAAETVSVQVRHRRRMLDI